MRLPVLAALAALGLAAPAAAELSDLGGREVTVVTENAYPPLQFVDPKTKQNSITVTRAHAPGTLTTLAEVLVKIITERGA